MEEVPFEALGSANLIVGAVYLGGPGTKTGDDPLSRLLGVGNQGGFRKSGNWRHPNFVALYTTEGDPDWPDEIDPVTQRLTYYGDNKKAGVDLLNTPLKGNRILKAAFQSLEGDRSGVPPFFVFVKAGHRKDMVFRGLAVPGSPEVDPANALEVVRNWGGGGRFENYKATFTILDVSSIDRRWLGELREGNALGDYCPENWRRWCLEGTYEARKSRKGGATTGPSRVLRSRLSPAGGDSDRESEMVGFSDDGGETPALGSYLRWLKSLSFGGNRMAVAPGQEELGISAEGPGVSGSDEAASWFSRRLDQEGGPPAFLFLVGGPGNGKSYLSAKIVRSLRERGDRHPELAQRTYTYATSGPDLLLVNDATIGMGTLVGESLVKDLDRAFEEGLHAVVNVNRGVLVEELAQDARPGFGQAAVEWLAGRVPTPNPDISFEPKEVAPFLEVAKVTRPGEQVVDLVAVFMDKVSLLERRPPSEVEDRNGGLRATAEDYKVCRFVNRKRELADAVPAAELLSEVLEQYPPGEGYRFDPIDANVQCLRHPTVRSGFLSVLRGSEIAASSRLTYRDLWGVIGQAIMGPLCEQPNDGDPLAWVGDNQPDRFENPRERLKAALRLAQLRTHQAIYLADSCPLAPVELRVHSHVLARVRAVDPVKDFLPGTRSPDWQENPSGYGWATPVSEGFEGHELGKSPMDGLREVIDNDDDAAVLAITRFDRLLDELVVEAEQGDDLTDREKRDLATWYGGYIARLYATAHGIPAFQGPIDWWTNVWAFANANPNAPGPYSDNVRALLFPEYPGIRGSLLLPVFESRVTPVTDEVDEPILVKAFQAGLALWDWDVNGDSIVLQFVQGHGRLIELDFDLAIVREMAACRSGKPGATENSHMAEPLLERFRAAMLRSQARPMPELWVVHRSGSQLLTVPE